MLRARFLVMLMLIWRGILAPAIAADPQLATFDGVVDSYDQTNRLILFLEQHQQQPVYLSLRGIWPFVSYDRSTCGPVFWQTPPDAESNDYFISGTQLCFKNDVGDYAGEFAEDNLISAQRYQLQSVDAQILLQGTFFVAGQIDRGRQGIWTIGLNPISVDPIAP